MIEINLLPGAGKKSRGGRATGAGIGSAVSGIGSSIKDPFLLGAVATVLVAVLAIGGMWFYQGQEADALDQRETQAQQDSTRYAAILKDKHKAESQRDSVLHQLDIIRSIDNDRYVWPHVMDEVSKALPAYTWLTSLAQTSAPQTASSVDAAKQKGDTTPVVVPGMKFRITGNTVDIQALTRFMRELEASPFIQNVQLAKSNLATVEGKEVTDFTLDAEYQKPDPSAVRTVPVALSVR